MSREILDCLKRKQDICIKNIIPSQNTAFMCTPALSVINLSRNKNICCGLKKVAAKSRARVYFEQQILALLLVFHQIHNLSRNKFARALANQPISAPHFFNLQQMFLLRVKLITQGEKRETSAKTCNETMLRDKLKVFVSRISPPLSKPRRRRQRERHQTKGLMSKTIAVYLHYKSLYISLPSSAKRLREMTKFSVLYGTWTTTANFSYFHLE